MRKYVQISEEELRAKLEALSEDKTLDFMSIYEHFRDNKDLKVSFDLENTYSEKGDFGSRPIGFQTLDGFPFWGFMAGGDWEMPVYFIVYWDGKKIRAYVPTEGNSYNTDTMNAYGNDEEADAKNLIKEGFAEKDEEYPEPPEPDFKKMFADIKERIQPR